MARPVAQLRAGSVSPKRDPIHREPVTSLPARSDSEFTFPESCPVPGTATRRFKTLPLFAPIPLRPPRGISASSPAPATVAKATRRPPACPCSAAEKSSAEDDYSRVRLQGRNFSNPARAVWWNVLPELRFGRVHRSWIVGWRHVLRPRRAPHARAFRVSGNLGADATYHPVGSCGIATAGVRIRDETGNRVR